MALEALAKLAAVSGLKHANRNAVAAKPRRAGAETPLGEWRLVSA